jgi:hypothetical protein
MYFSEPPPKEIIGRMSFEREFQPSARPLDFQLCFLCAHGQHVFIREAIYRPAEQVERSDG